MCDFRIKVDYQPEGDQPKSIERLSRNINSGKKAQTLLGVTGSGKTFTIANIIEKVSKPTLIMAHNKTLAAQLYEEFKEIFLIMKFTILLVITITINLKHIFPHLIPTLRRILKLMSILII